MAINVHDPVWVEVTKWATERLAMHRERLDTIGLPMNETEGCRHAIKELEALLELPKPSKLPVV